MNIQIGFHDIIQHVPKSIAFYTKEHETMFAINTCPYLFLKQKTGVKYVP